MAFENLPGIRDYKVDGNLGQLPANQNPKVVIIGTAERGDTEILIPLSRTSAAPKLFGKKGTLTRGVYEAASGGALNISAMRIGATPAVLTSIAGTTRIETVEKDDSAGSDYALFYDASEQLLQIFRVSDNEVVWDNVAGIDLGEVYVTGTVAHNDAGTDIGTALAPVKMKDVVLGGGATFTAGSDGLSLSRMRLWEELYKAYRLLEDADLDFVVPMNVYLDDKNIQDMTSAEVTALQTNAPWAASSVYPTAGTLFDVLGKVFVQEYQGQYYFWWDLDRDGQAEVFPSVGSADATHSATNVALTSADFHEVNFAYDLAKFCFDKSENNDEVLGVIGVRPPQTFSLADIATWVGTSPVSALDPVTGKNIISVNGTGLLGNKFMVGRKTGSGGSAGLPGLSIDGVDGLVGGGFIATDGEFLDDGSQLKDNNDALVDLGKYISVVGAQIVMSNAYQDAAYVASAAPQYAGFITSLPANSAPTNKVMDNCSLPYRLNLARLDALAGAKYVMLQSKPKGIVVSDAPTAARSESDYRRLSTVRIVKSVLDAIRSVADPFIGEAIVGARLAALETAIEQVLAKLTKAQFIQRYDYTVISTSQDQVLGRATVNLTLVPAFELRQINVVVSLAAQ